MAVYLDDKRLANRLLAGDEPAFNRFFEENFARLYRFAQSRLPDDPEAVREIVQDTLHRALRKLHTYRAEAALFTWLCAICRREIADWLERQQRYRDHIVLIEDRPEIQAALDSFEVPAETEPDEIYRRAEAGRLIQVALDHLPAKYGDVLEWKYIEGRSVKDIAARLDIGAEAAQSLLARAKRAFADVYGTLSAALREDDAGVRP
jgi:RNA polymerase sigma-70 factor (ECF subfamily)